MPEDDIRTALRLLERSVEPPPGLADAVFAQLVEELEAEPSGETRPILERRRRPLARRARPRRRLTLIAAALAVVTALVAGLFVVLPHPQSAFALVQQARKEFGHLPSLRAIIERVVTTKQLRSEVGKTVPDWVQVMEIDYRDPQHSRIRILSDRNDPFEGDQTGAFTVFNPRYEGVYDPATKTFGVTPAKELLPGSARNTALLYLSPEFQQGPKLTDQAIREGCSVLPETTVTGRPAEHIACKISPIPQEGLYPGARAQVFLDKETGAVLEMLFPNGGLVEVKRIQYRPTFAPDTFAVAQPKESHVSWNGQGPPPPPFRVKGLSPEVSAVVRVGDQPQDLVAGEGAVWTSTGSGWVARVDPHTLKVTHIPAPAETVENLEGFSCERCRLVRRLKNGAQVWDIQEPGNLAVGGGSVWVTGAFSNTLGRIDPATNRFVGTPQVIHLPVEGHHCEGWPPGVNACYTLTGRMVFAYRSLWMISPAGGGWFLNGNACCNSAILRIDPRTRRLRAVYPIPGTGYEIAAGFGSLWMSGTTQSTSRADFGHPVLWRIDPSSGHIQDTIPCADPNGGYGCNRLAAGEGGIWFTNGDERPGHGAVGRVDPATGRVVARIRGCREPNGVAVGGGSVWVACTASNRVIEIDPRTGNVIREIKTGGEPVSVVVGYGFVWVANRDDGTVARIDLR